MIRQFETGATRDSDDHKLDYEAFLSYPVLERYAQYMHAHRLQSDGTLRDGDNWQKGIPISAYRKSLLRHAFQLWGVQRNYDVYDDKGEIVDESDAICAVIFNAMGMLHELLKEQS